MERPVQQERRDVPLQPGAMDAEPAQPAEDADPDPPAGLAPDGGALAVGGRRR